MPKIIPIKDLKDTGMISEMCAGSEEPIFITKNGYGEMVIMSMEVYEEKMFMNDVYSRLAAAEEQVKTGQVMDASESIRLIREQLHG